MKAKRIKPSTVFITGASSGIGRALAIEYAKRGAHVVVSARREVELGSLCDQINRAASEGPGSSARATPMVLDVADFDAAYGAAKRAEAILGSLDMVIANAGVGSSAHAARLPLRTVVQTMNINATGAMATLMGAIPIMMGQRAGHIVGVSSLAGRRALPGTADYSASKAALSTFLEGLRLDLEPAGLRITDVQPGFVDTAMTQKNDFPMPFMWDAPRAAHYIADRLERGPGIIAFPPPLDVLTRLSRILPFWVHAAATRASRNRGDGKRRP